MKILKVSSIIVFMLSMLVFEGLLSASVSEYSEQASDKTSNKTKSCIGCHTIYTPGIINDWLSSLHSKNTPASAMKKPELERRISVKEVKKELSGYVVGCYECHSLNTDNHKDSFEHFGNKINIIVSPSDCNTCHPKEVKEYTNSKKYFAYKNIIENPLYLSLINNVLGIKKFSDKKITFINPSDTTLHETCLGCHGTKVEVRGKKTIKKATRISIEIPDLTNWPNQGVGRINPDDSQGVCTACHPRHSFSIEIARKPFTCSQCHLEPDVPAWNVYDESKHGDIFLSKYHEWNFNSVPWILGKDFKTPTCSACHNSLLVSPEGVVIAERTHDFGSRLWVRIFGLIYSHPQPISGDTTIIRNSDGLPLPTSFRGEPAYRYLIKKEEQEERQKIMMNICNNCHSYSWVIKHFSKLNATLKETDDMILTTTNILLNAWDKGIEDKINPFDESLEHMWIKQWLFYANSIRYASAMTGAPDYTAFKNGWWYLTENIEHMKEWLEIKEELIKEKHE